VPVWGGDRGRQNCDGDDDALTYSVSPVRGEAPGAGADVRFEFMLAHATTVVRFMQAARCRVGAIAGRR
jgi:hypothetical protein